MENNKTMEDIVLESFEMQDNIAVIHEDLSFLNLVL